MAGFIKPALNKVAHAYAKAEFSRWIPAYAGMTEQGNLSARLTGRKF